MKKSLFIAGLIFLAALSQSCKKAEKTVPSSDKKHGQKTHQIRNHRGKSNDFGLPDLTNSTTWLDKDGVPVRLDSKSIVLFLNEIGEDNWDLDGEYGGYLRSLFYWCSPDDFDSALQIYSKARGGAGKNMFLEALFRSFLNNRGPAALADVLNSVNKTFGVGKLAEGARFSAFRTAGLSSYSLEEVGKVGNPTERDLLLRSMQFSLEYAQDISNIKAIDVSKLGADERSLLYSALALRVKNSKGLGRSFDDVLKESLNLVKSPKETAELLSKCAEKSPYEMWKFLSSQTSGLDEVSMQAARTASIVGIARQNGDQALTSVLELKPGPAKAELLQLGMSSFLASNSVGAEEWLQKNEKKLSSSEIDSAETSIAQFAAKNGDLDKAKAFTDRINDLDLRKRTEGQVWTAERDYLRNDIAKDPSGTMQAIVSGQSKYADYWLEEAMGTWVAKDFDKAQEWYQKNWNSMPASKSQFLAAAFANQAASQGDTVTARQWAAHIEDAKTKQRIEAGIAKAEAAKSN